MLQPMKSLKLMFLNFFSLVILSELTIKCVIRFGKFMRIFRNKGNGINRLLLFSMFNGIELVVLCRSEEFFFHLNGIV